MGPKLSDEEFAEDYADRLHEMAEDIQYNDNGYDEYETDEFGFDNIEDDDLEDDETF